MTTPPTPDRSPSFFARFSLFGWLCVVGGGAFLYTERANISAVTMGGGLALVILGGVCVDRTPVVTFVTLVTGALAAWRGKRDP